MKVNWKGLEVSKNLIFCVNTPLKLKKKIGAEGRKKDPRNRDIHNSFMTIGIFNLKKGYVNSL